MSSENCQNSGETPYELHSYIEGLKQRDKKLNDMVSNHSTQMKNWETEHRKIIKRKEKVRQAEELLKVRNKQVELLVQRLKATEIDKRQNEGFMKEAKNAIEKASFSIDNITKENQQLKMLYRKELEKRTCIEKELKKLQDQNQKYSSENFPQDKCASELICKISKIEEKNFTLQHSLERASKENLRLTALVKAYQDKYDSLKNITELPAENVLEKSMNCLTAERFPLPEDHLAVNKKTEEKICAGFPQEDSLNYSDTKNSNLSATNPSQHVLKNCALNPLLTSLNTLQCPQSSNSLAMHLNNKIPIKSVTNGSKCSAKEVQQKLSSTSCGSQQVNTRCETMSSYQASSPASPIIHANSSTALHHQATTTMETGKKMTEYDDDGGTGKLNRKDYLFSTTSRCGDPATTTTLYRRSKVFATTNNASTIDQSCNVASCVNGDAGKSAPSKAVVAKQKLPETVGNIFAEVFGGGFSSSTPIKKRHAATSVADLNSSCNTSFRSVEPVDPTSKDVVESTHEHLTTTIKVHSPNSKKRHIVTINGRSMLFEPTPTCSARVRDEIDDDICSLPDRFHPVISLQSSRSFDSLMATVVDVSSAIDDYEPLPLISNALFKQTENTSETGSFNDKLETLRQKLTGLYQSSLSLLSGEDDFESTTSPISESQIFLDKVSSTSAVPTLADNSTETTTKLESLLSDSWSCLFVNDGT